MGIIIDIILIAILILSTFLGYKKGLVKLGAKLFAGIIAIILTLILYRPVANAIIKNTPIEDKIKNVIVENASNFIKEENENTNEISTQITKQVTNQVKNEMLPGEAENIAKGVVYALTAIILFVVVKIILSIVVSLIDGIAKLPILKQFNEVGGMAYGIVRGLLIICIAVLLMGVYTKIKPESTLNTKIQESFITKILYENIVKF
jgi:colicin V production protein